MLDLTLWAEAEALTIRQAACLWAGAEPAEFDFQLPAHLRAVVALQLAALCDAIIKGELEVEVRQNPLAIIGNHDKSAVTREALVRFATKCGQRPAFLFPTSAPATKAEARSSNQQVSRPNESPPPAPPVRTIPSRRRSTAMREDDAIIEALHEARKGGGDGFSIRAFVIDRDKKIAGANIEAKIRRITKKYGERYPD